MYDLGPTVQISGFRLSGFGMIMFILNPKPKTLNLVGSGFGV